MALFFGIFLLAGLGFLFPFAKASWLMVDSRGWEQVDCRVLSSQVGSSSDSDGTTYRVEISFEYTYRGEQRRSERYDFMGSMYSSGIKGKQRAVDRHPAGSACRAWVNPDDPDQAVLDRSPGATLWFALIPLVFVVVGGGGIAGALGWLVFERRSKRASARGKEPTGGPSGTPEVARTGPLVLKPNVGPVAKVLGILFIAAFWNGIVGVFVYQLWKSWQSGSHDWFLLLFLIPFELVGLALIVAIPYVLLQSFNPRATIELASSTLALGDGVDLRWRFRGRTSRLERLTLRLKGQESASYTVGTDTRTATSIFHDEVIFETQHRQAMAVGAARLRIPEDSMHTFEGGRNKVVWLLELSGDIARWPDIDDSYTLEIGPRRELEGSPETSGEDL